VSTLEQSLHAVHYARAFTTEKDHIAAESGLTRLLQDIDPIAPRHDQVADDDVDALGVAAQNRRRRLGAPGGADAAIPHVSELPGQEAEHELVVVDDQDARPVL
jgi:hypothetical protein